MISKTAKTKVLKVTEEWSLSTNPVFTLSSSAANLRKLKTMTSNTSKIVATITPEQATEGTEYSEHQKIHYSWLEMSRSGLIMGIKIIEKLQEMLEK